MRPVWRAAHLPLILTALLAPAAWAQTPAENILASYVKRAGAPASAERGQAFFTRQHKGGVFDSCSSCHTADPLKRGRDEVAEKPIPALAPAVTKKNFTDASRVEHLFKLNCKDVLSRECTAQEKADVIAWLISLKP